MNESIKLKSSPLEKNSIERKFVPFSEKNLKTKKLLTDLYDSLSDAEFLKAHNEAQLHAKALKGRYADYYSHALYHILIDSSLSLTMGTITEDDFQGEDSVEKFIEHLITTYGKKTE